jgi:Methyltransferase domain
MEMICLLKMLQFGQVLLLEVRWLKGIRLMGANLIQRWRNSRFVITILPRSISKLNQSENLPMRDYAMCSEHSSDRMGRNAQCGSNIRRVGITPECKEHLSKAKQPRLLEISMGVKSLPPIQSILILAPTLVSYANDYPHGKFYVTCQDEARNIDLPSLDLSLEAIVGGQKSFSKLDFADNFFDVICAGLILDTSELTCRSIQFMLTKTEWPDVLSECYRILKPGYPHSSTQ